MPDWLGPEDQWPSHPDAVWRDALRFAREWRWSFKPAKGHSFGQVSCKASDGGDRCFRVVFTTGRARENVARDLVKAVRTCPHRAGSGIDVLSLAEDRLAGAERLTNAAEKQWSRAQARAEADRILRLLLQAEGSLDDVDEQLDEAARLERQAGGSDPEVASTAAEFDLDPASGPEQFADRADDVLGEAQHYLEDAPRERRWRRLRARVSDLRTRLHGLRRDIQGTNL